MCAALRPLQACPLSGGKFRFPSRAIPCPKSLPLQARLGLLFLFLPFFCPFVLPPAWRGWLSLIQVRRLFWIRSQLGHTGPRACLGFRWIGSLQDSKNFLGHTGRVGFSPTQSLPLPLKGEGRGIVFLGFAGFALLVQTDSHWPNRAGLGLRQCRFPTLPSNRP